jgi:lipopolysaccharide export system protein LptA
MRSAPYCGGAPPDPAARRARFRRRGAAAILPVLLGLAAAAGALAAAVDAGPPLPDRCKEYRDLCAQADRRGAFDAAAGVAELEGNVVGHLKSRNLSFQSQLLRAHRGAEGEWERLVLSTKVRLAVPPRMVEADHSVIEHASVLVSGNARLTHGDLVAESEDVLLERDEGRATLRGSPGEPVRLRFTQPDIARAPPPAEGSGAGEPLMTRAWARKIVVEEDGRQVTLTGQVQVDAPDRKIRLSAESVALAFADNNAIASFQARGDVVIIQPGRRLSADSVRSQSRMQTVLLQGRAHARQDGQFEIASDRIEIFTDPKKGYIRSEDRQRPMSLSLDVGSVRTFRLDPFKLQELILRGVPSGVTEKLDPLAGRLFNGVEAFRQAVGGQLTLDESQRYLSLILAQAAEARGR